jgi:beta-glucanase (GH16 family)
MNAKAAGICIFGAIAFTAFADIANAQNFSIRPMPFFAPWAAHDATEMPLRPITISDSDEDRDADFDQHDRTLGTLIFRDEFRHFQIWNGRDGWDVTGGPQWTALGRVVPQGTEPYNNELGWYLNPSFQPPTVNPFSADDGILSIKATPYPQKTYFDLFPYTTGIITSYQSFRHLYGYFEMRAKLPRGQGFLPAFWLLPADGSHAEIDAMEVLGSDPTKLYTTVHSFATGPDVVSGTTTTIPDASKGFHTYGVDWQSDYITWYFDGRQVFQAKTPTDLNTPMYMIANVAVGGGWPGVPAAGSAAEMKIDYIRVYKFNFRRKLVTD